MKKHSNRFGGFTLIEISIVLVVIGLLVGGVLVGRDLIAAAAVRAQISQIEKYQQAVNTFRGKYGYLPGDIPDPDATKFGFSARSNGRGRGDGNGVLEAPDQYYPPATGWPRTSGELGVFWLDISQARLIDGNLSGCSGGCFNSYSGGDLDSSLPKAKIGDGTYVNVFSGGWQLSWPTGSDNKNYFLVAKQFYNEDGDLAVSTSLTVAQAYAIDRKMDDSLPQYGKVMALVMNLGNNIIWASGQKYNTGGISASGAALDGNAPLDSTTVDAVSPDDQTCYDTRGNTGVRAEYSITWKNGMMPNCSLGFQFQ